MNIAELRAAVMGTARDDWNLVDSYGAGSSAPLPLRPEPVASNTVQRFAVRRHTMLLVLNADVDVSVAWGMHAESPQTQIVPHGNLSGEDTWTWHREFADIRFRGSLVDRHVVLQLDGLAGATLPAGEVDVSAGSGAPPRLIAVTRIQYGLARLLHQARYGDAGQFDRFLRGGRITGDGPERDVHLCG